MAPEGSFFIVSGHSYNEFSNLPWMLSAIPQAPFLPLLRPMDIAREQREAGSAGCPGDTLAGYNGLTLIQRDNFYIFPGFGAGA